MYWGYGHVAAGGVSDVLGVFQSDNNMRHNWGCDWVQLYSTSPQRSTRRSFLIQMNQDRTYIIKLSRQHCICKSCDKLKDSIRTTR